MYADQHIPSKMTTTQAIFSLMVANGMTVTEQIEIQTHISYHGCKWCDKQIKTNYNGTNKSKPRLKLS